MHTYRHDKQGLWPTARCRVSFDAALCRLLSELEFTPVQVRIREIREGISVACG